MSKAGLTILLGFVVFIVPFLGIPTEAKVAVSALCGLTIIVLGVLMREERRLLMRALQGEHSTDAYTENSAQAYASASPDKTP